MNNSQFSERLIQSPNISLQKYHSVPRLQGSWKIFDIYMTLFKAHAIMLSEQGIVARDHIRAILRELVSIDDAGFTALTLRPELSDLYLNLQMILIDRLGKDIGGRLHTAISRNDFELAVARLYARERINACTSGVLKLMKALLNLAEKNVETVMPGYTHHSQAAQPITLGHFLLAHYDVFARDIERLAHAYAVANCSPMGSCALATTGFPVNRERVADLIGCDGLVENSVDATGGRDFLLQLGTVVAIAFSNMGRLVESLYLWNTPEFGMIELADQYCTISSMMPQKKNPVAFEVLRAESVRVPDMVNAAFGVLKAIPLANGREPGYGDGPINESAEKLEVLAPILADIISTLKIHPDVMLAKAEKDFGTMTELADEIVRQTDLPYHQTYVIVGKLVTKLQEHQETALAITSSRIDEVAQEVVGKVLNLPEDAVARAINPVRNVQLRSVIGGPAPVEVKRMLGNRFKLQDELERQLEKRCERLEYANSKLDITAREMIVQEHSVGQ